MCVKPDESKGASGRRRSPLQRLVTSKPARKCAVLVASLGGALMLIEGASVITGVVRPEPTTYVGEFTNRPSRNFIADEQIGWKMHPHHTFSWSTAEFDNTYTSGAEGFRSNRDFADAHDRRRILLAGDSFTFGTGVDYDATYGVLLGERLRDTVVLNVAMPGFGLDQVWCGVRHQLKRYQPDLVIVGIFPSMFTRSLSAYRRTEGFNKPTFHVVDGELVERTTEDRPPRVVQLLERSSALWGLGVRALRGIGYRFPVGDWWCLNKALLDGIRAACREEGVPVLFVYIPSDRWRSFVTLRAYMAETRQHFVDLTDPMFAGAAPSSELFFPHDGHINERGHRFVADALLPVVKRILGD